jgi:hypothetical protein
LNILVFEDIYQDHENLLKSKVALLTFLVRQALTLLVDFWDEKADINSNH